MADPDEPFFVLKGRHKYSGPILRAITNLCRAWGYFSKEEAEKHRELADRMDNWHKSRKFGPHKDDGKGEVNASRG